MTKKKSNFIFKLSLVVFLSFSLTAIGLDYWSGRYYQTRLEMHQRLSKSALNCYVEMETYKVWIADPDYHAFLRDQGVRVDMCRREVESIFFKIEAFDESIDGKIAKAHYDYNKMWSDIFIKIRKALQ